MSSMDFSVSSPCTVTQLGLSPTKAKLVLANPVVNATVATAARKNPRLFIVITIYQMVDYLIFSYAVLRQVERIKQRGASCLINSPFGKNLPSLPIVNDKDISLIWRGILKRPPVDSTIHHSTYQPESLSSSTNFMGFF